jgi:3D (Asp-Asp-Asp) domain-containing protein
MSIPGYGDGIAADTGGAVVGWTIDMWVADCGEADAYGRQTITITIYN